MYDNSYGIEWVPLKLSNVEYLKDDIIGKALALVSVSYLVVLSAFIVLIIFRRDLHTITFFIGLLINEILASVLKYLIADPRPISRSSDYTEYGMPSSHSQLMWYLSTYMFYFIFFRMDYVKTDLITYFWKISTVAFFFIWATLMAISRVYLKYHSIEQVVCGAFIGILFATFWFFITQYFFTPLFPIVVSWKISEILLIRDTTLIPNILWFEYTSVRQEVRSRRRKSDSRKSQ